MIEHFDLSLLNMFSNNFQEYPVLVDTVVNVELVGTPNGRSRVGRNAWALTGPPKDKEIRNITIYQILDTSACSFHGNGQSLPRMAFVGLD